MNLPAIVNKATRFIRGQEFWPQGQA